MSEIGRFLILAPKHHGARRKATVNGGNRPAAVDWGHRLERLLSIKYQSLVEIRQAKWLSWNWKSYSGNPALR